MFEKKEKTYEIYQVSFNYYVEIEDKGDMVDIWLYKEGYGVKMYVLGLYKEIDYLEIVKDNIYDYIKSYEEMYVNEQ